MDYRLIDSGGGRKLEKFGPYTLIRPAANALWKPKLSREWEEATASFSRDEGNRWEGFLPKSWVISHEGIRFSLSPTDFGHLGIFPEHSYLWKWAAEQAASRRGVEVLNLFAYSGGATLALAKAGAKVCHLDASQGMVHWARENAKLNRLEEAPIRWIVDDAMKFLGREIRRGRRYDGILLDPPSFGRGANGEVFKIERDLAPLLEIVRDLLSESPLFVICSNHTSGLTSLVMQNVLEDTFGKGVESGELVLYGEGKRPLPTGSFARWSP